MRLTTVARVLATLKSGGQGFPDTQTEALAELGRMIDSVSVQVNEHLSGRCERKERVERHDLRSFQRLIRLKGWPLAVDADGDLEDAFDLRIDALRAFGGDTVVDPETYHVDAEDGYVELDVAYPEGAGIVRVAYTGGMAEPTVVSPGHEEAEAFVAAYPDVASAVERQVIARWRSRNNPAGTKNPTSTRGRSAPEPVSGELIVDVVQALEPHRRKSIF